MPNSLGAAICVTDCLYGCQKMICDMMYTSRLCRQDERYDDKKSICVRQKLYAWIIWLYAKTASYIRPISGRPF